jgi:hypothetical protein
MHQGISATLFCHHGLQWAGIAVVLQICVLNVLSSNLGWNTNCSDLDFYWFSNIPPSTYWDSA